MELTDKDIERYRKRLQRQQENADKLAREEMARNPKRKKPNRNKFWSHPSKLLRSI